jgi:hypothetical protein
MSRWLLERMFEVDQRPVPRFAFNGTVNWMRALAFLVQQGDFEADALTKFYSEVKRRDSALFLDNQVFENILMSAHSHSALSSMVDHVPHGYDICRSAIQSWYYTIYFSSLAMVSAASGANPGSHEGASKVWNSVIVEPRLAVGPFSLLISTLTPKEAAAQIQALRGNNSFDLSTAPGNVDHAWGAIFSYLKGTVEFEREKHEERIRDTAEFNRLGVTDFRTKMAREIRDAELSKECVNFLVQAIRYRGKANYRDSLFLSYGSDESDRIDIFLADLVSVASAFMSMAACYSSKRVEGGTWSEFVKDLRDNVLFGAHLDLIDF